MEILILVYDTKYNHTLSVLTSVGPLFAVSDNYAFNHSINQSLIVIPNHARMKTNVLFFFSPPKKRSITVTMVNWRMVNYSDSILTCFCVALQALQNNKSVVCFN